MTPTFIRCRASNWCHASCCYRAVSARRVNSLSTVVPELELDAEILAAEEGDRFLQIVARRRRDPYLISLDGGLDFPELGLLDRGGEFFRGLAVEGHLERDFAADGVAPRRRDLSRIQVLY